MPGYRGLKHSIWDRLLDPRPIAQERAEATPYHELERLKNEIRRDLEWLLNTRLADSKLHQGMDQLKQSLVNYGLIDLNTLSLADDNDRKRLQASLQQALAHFEPRLRNVRIVPDETATGEVLRAIHFRIHADLRTDPAEPITFDTTLELGTRAFSVK
ncbi:MAG: type VI secretion system baseplate subunit TssE [Isosphaeraceae bacterium]